MVWLILTCVVLLCILLLYLPVEVRAHYEHWKQDDQGFLEVRFLYGLIRYRRELTGIQTHVTDGGPTVSVKQEANNKKDSEKAVSTSDVAGLFTKLRPMLDFARASKRILKRLFRHVYVHELQLEANLGLSDAAVTGATIGFLYTVIETLLGYTTRLWKYRTTPEVEIRPVFNQTLFHIKTQSIMRVRLGYAITASIRLFLAWRRRT